MARDGSGSFSRLFSWVTDAANGIKIRADRTDNEMDGFATALSESIARDGQTTITADLPMAGFRHTSIGNASARDDYAAAGQAQDSAFLWGGTAGGTADALTITLTPVITAYAAGQVFRFISGVSANTGAATVDINGVGAVAIESEGAALAAGDITTSALHEITYDGTAFQLSAAGVPVTLHGVQTITGAKTFSAALTVNADQTIASTDAGAGAGPSLIVDRASASPAASDIIGQLLLRFRNDTGVPLDGATLVASILDPATGSEATRFLLQTYVAGTKATRLNVAAGLWMDGASSGDPGADLVNTKGYEVDGVRIPETVAGAATLSAGGVLTVPAASKAEMETASSLIVVSTPGQQHSHPGHPKAWVVADMDAGNSILDDYGVSSITDNFTGDYTVNMSTAFSTANYAGVAQAGDNAAASLTLNVTGPTNAVQTTTAWRMQVEDINTSAFDDADAERLNAAFYGDQ